MSTAIPASASTAQRRQMLQRLVNQICHKGGPWSTQDVERFGTYSDELKECNALLEGTRDGLHHRAFNAYLRYGIENLTGEMRSALMEKRADLQTENYGAAYPGSTSGFIVPMLFIDAVTEATKYTGPMFTNATVRDTPSGAPMPFPQDDDTSISGIAVPESGQITVQDITIKQTVLSAYKYSSKAVTMSMEELQDSKIDIEACLTKKFGIRLGRVLEPLFVNGTGTAPQPTGFVTNLQAASSPTVAATGSSGNTGGPEGANTIGSDDLANLEMALDPSYRLGAKFMMHPNTLNALRRVRDKSGRPLFWALENDTPTLLGYEILLNPNMDQLQSEASSPQPVTVNSVAFGDWSKYVIRRATPIMLRLTERYCDYGMVAFVLHWRVDANLIDGSAANRAVVLLQNTY